MKRILACRLVCILLFQLVCFSEAVAQNLRQLTVDDGLASSAVTAIHQSPDGLLWFGTLDGMNLYYGEHVERTEMNTLGALEGYLIERILETKKNHMWIQTTYGLHKLDRLSRNTVSFLQFTGGYRLELVGDDHVMVLDTKQQLHLYHPERETFRLVDFSLTDGETLVGMGGTDEFCWFAGNKGVYRYQWVEKEEVVSLDQAVSLTSSPIKFCQKIDDTDFIYVIDERNNLYRLDIRKNEMTFVLDLSEDLAQRGMPSGIVEINGAYIISFKVSGALKLRYELKERKWLRQDLGINSGVFRMIKDRFQDLIWLATDGQGVFAYWEGSYNIRSYSYSDFSFQFGKPIRALFVDDKDWLWIGTKGEGLIGIDRSDKTKDIHLASQRLLTSHNSALEDNSIYALSASNFNGFWVGSEGGLNFYSYATRSLHPVNGGKDIEYVHSVQEVGDSVLWVATVGKGVFKANISKNGSSMQLGNIRHFEVEGGHFSSNYFFAMHYTADGDLWLGNRGYGVFKMYPYGLEPTAWPNKQRSQLLDDVFALYEHKDVLWIGTSCGLLGLGPDGKEWYLNQSDGLPNNIVRSLQMDSKDGLWIATNNGLARMDVDDNDIKTYGRKDGLRVTEFSDGATLRTEDALYFGAMNGWVEVTDNSNYIPTEEYCPPLYLINFRGVEDKKTSLHLLTLNNHTEGVPEIELERDENAFSVTFMALDYVNLGDYQYFYKIDSDKEGTWVDNGKHTMLSLTQLFPGEYTLSVKYRNHMTDYESEPVRLKIHIKPYWWQTGFMQFLYWLCAFVGISYLPVMQYTKVKRRHAYALKAMEQLHKEELYEEKLRFFTNITHEFSTPLTLIYSPCERILSHEGTDDFVRKYVTLIKKHTEKLYLLIQEVIDYRRIETKHQQLHLERYNLSEYMVEACAAFQDMAEKNGVVIEQYFEKNVFWHMDRRCFPKVVANLLSNALKYTPRGGVIKVSLVKLSEKEMQLKVYNTGKGIKEEDRLLIFNRYSVLDEVEEDASKILSRNGLGMAICHSSVQLLEGKIEIESEVGKYAEFIVTLPLLPLPEGQKEATVKDVVSLGMQNLETSKQFPIEPVVIEEPKVEEEGVSFVHLPSEDQSMVLVVDDNPDILFLLREVLSQQYEVKTASNADEALEQLKQIAPDLIITDVMMPGTGGMSLTKQIKQNKHTMHIPLIMLSAKNTDEAKTEGLQSGADAYIGKPFNVQYLQAVVDRLVESRKDMREYYNTSASAYGFVEGQLVKTEDKEFMYLLNEVVERNLSNGSLTTEMIADEMHVSLRSLYRRLKELNLPSPKDYVRERKMEKAVKLLQTSNMSIQEILFECGFNNRAYFYKEFSKRFGTTPKEFRNSANQQDHSLEKA